MLDQNELEKRLLKLEARVTLLEAPSTISDVNTSKGATKKLSIKEFLISKNLANDVQRTLAIAYYFEKYEDYQSFNAQDIKKGFKLAKEPSPVNVNDKINLNIKRGFLMEADDKKESTKAWVLTNTGVKFVENGFTDKE